MHSKVNQNAQKPNTETYFLYFGIFFEGQPYENIELLRKPRGQSPNCNRGKNQIYQEVTQHEPG